MEKKPAWEIALPQVQDAPVIDSSRLYRFQLENGLRAIIFRDARLPYVSLGLAARTGAGTVPYEDAGLAVFTSAMMEQGAGGRDALEFARVVEVLGADFGVSASWDSTIAKIGGLSGDFETLFRLLADVVLRPQFSKSEARRLRAELLADLERDKDDPRELVARVFAETLYPGHRYGIPLSGSPDSVSRFSTSDAYKFYDRVFVPENAVLFASGDVDVETFVNQAKFLFGGWSQEGQVSEILSTPTRKTRELVVVLVDRPDLRQAQILIGHEGLARTDERRIPASLVNLVLGGAGFSSRLMSRIRSESGLTYGVNSHFSLRRHSGPFVISTFTRVPEVRRVVDLVLAELVRIAKDPPDEEELRNAKTLSTGRFALGLETSHAVVRSLVDLDIHSLPDNSLDTFRIRVQNVDETEIARVTAELVHPDRVIIAVVGPANILAGQLEGLGRIRTVVP